MFNMLKNEKLMRIIIKEPQNQTFIYERIADDFFKPSFTNELQLKSFNVDILSDEFQYYLLADLPGCRSEDLKIHFEDQYLTIEVHRDSNLMLEGVPCIRKERAEGHLIRRFFIEAVDFEQMTFKIENGLLVLRLPKINI